MEAAMIESPTRYPVVFRGARMRVPLKSWAVDPEEQVLDQGRNLAMLPFALRHVAIMADGHTGYGMPIGGVLFADRAILPYCVGVDIGCGVQLIGLGLSVDELTPAATLLFLENVSALVPVGNGPVGQHSAKSADLPMFQAPERTVVGSPMAEILDTAEAQLGTLGGGNHFVELQAGADGRAYVMIHSGSRSVGKKVCDRHHAVALELAKRWHLDLPDKFMAWLPWDTAEAKDYWNDMTIALAWAEENRRRTARAVDVAARGVLGAETSLIIDVHHNYAAWENHHGKNGIVHRKGAVRARAGETVLIPGSMGTASYVARGLGSEESFQSCQHGAGRTMSRSGARRAMRDRDLEADLDGVVLVTPDRAGVVDEAPIAYKDVEAVMAASADLVEPTMRLTPLGVLKG